MVEVSLTVGKLDASLALLLTKDHHLIEFPTILLPDGVQAGSIIKIKCDRDLELEKEQQEKFNEVQDSILELYGKKEPEPPILKVKNVTQTSCVLEWEKLQLANASIKSLSLYKNNVRLGQIPNALVNTTTKLSGLPLDTSFKFRLRLDTTSGVYYSNELEIKTHKMTDLSGITICLGEINYEEEGYTEEDIEVLLSNIDGKPIQKEVQVDTTHFICTLAKGPQWKRAVDNNIPVVRPEWLKACLQEKRLAGVRSFYLDANLDMLKKYKIVSNEPLINKRRSMLIKEQEQFDEVSLDQTPKVAAAESIATISSSAPEPIKNSAIKEPSTTNEMSASEQEKVIPSEKVDESAMDLKSEEDENTKAARVPVVTEEEKKEEIAEEIEDSEANKKHPSASVKEDLKEPKEGTIPEKESSLELKEVSKDEAVSETKENKDAEQSKSEESEVVQEEPELAKDESNIIEEATFTEPTEVSKPAETTGELSSTEVTEEANPTEITEEANPTEITEEANPTEITEEANPTEITEEVKLTEITEEVKPIKVTEEVKSTETTEEAKRTEITENPAEENVSEEVEVTDSSKKNDVKETKE